MAYPTSVNDQITDAVKNTTPATEAESLATQYAALENSLNAFYANAATAQEHLAAIRSALVDAGVPISAAAPIVNPQITDAAAPSKVNVSGDSAAEVMGNLFVATSQALRLAAENATSAQQQLQVTMQAATTQGITTIYGIDTASTGIATTEIFQ